jgi:glycosyltransferase involved in cell wall biosynthesis
LKVSIVIPSFNGAHRLPNIIKALQNQSIKGFEICVVVDGSSDNSMDVLNEIKEKHQIQVTYQNNSGRAKTRNTGAKQVTGDLLIFYDDDTRPCEDSIARHIDFHLKLSNAIYGGNQLEDLEVLKTDIQFYKAHLSRKWTAKYQSGLNQLNGKNLFLTAANMSIPKTLFELLGGFNEKLTDAEDYELAVRAYEKGIPIYFDKSNIAWHDDLITCKSYIKRQRQYNAMTDPLNALLPSKYRRNHKSRQKLPFFKYLVYAFFATKYWPNWIDTDRLTFLPQSLRYKIYDFVITSLGQYFPEKKYG